MEDKKIYEKPQIDDSVNLQAIAGACGAITGGKGTGVCTLVLNS